MGDIILAGKFAICIGCIAVSLILLRHPKPYSISDRSFTRLCLLLMAVSRLGVYIGVYFILREEVMADVASAYYPQGLSILDGQLVYRDFESSYSPLFPYLMAGILLCWNSAKAIVLSAIVIELISLPFWLSVARHYFNDRTARTAALLYVTSPVPLLNVALNGQNQVWISLLLAVALWLLIRKDFLSGVVFGFALGGIKLLGLLFAPIVWLFAERRLRWLLGYAMLPALTYGIFYALVGDALFYPLQRQGVHITAGNLYYFSSLFGVDINDPANILASTVITLLALATVFFIVWVRGAHHRPANLIHVLSIILLTMFLFSKKAYASYFVLSFFTFCLSLSSNRLSLRAILLFGGIGLLAALEPSLFFRWMQKHELDVIWATTLPQDLVRSKVIIFILWDLILLVSYVVCLALIWRRLEFPNASDEIDEDAVGQKNSTLGQP